MSEQVKGASPRGKTARNGAAAPSRTPGRASSNDGKVDAKRPLASNTNAADNEFDLASAPLAIALKEQLERHIEERPLVVLAAAVGVGFSLGALVSTRLGKLALVSAAGFALTRVASSESVRNIVSDLMANAESEIDSIRSRS
jgi:hypothetical protein